MINIPYKEDILNASTTFGIPASLIAAIIKVESDFVPQAYRYESKVNDSSYGLMQILTGTAKMVMGASVSTEDLYNPTKNIIIGTKYLQSLYAIYNNQDDTISAYNAGKPFKYSDGTYKNQVYVDNVNWWIKIYNYILPYGDYAIPGIFVIGSVLILLWSMYAKRR
jgi:soluble lytic murein transglycosylase-like protein